MLVRMIAGSLSLLAFSAAILAGVWAGNDWSTVLFRAWWVMILFLILGAMIGWVAKAAVDEHLETTTRRIMEQMESTEATPQNAATTEVRNVG